jgi:ABC-type cobalamin/Fe3+-siderophores transport system ATPase subunit
MDWDIPQTSGHQLPITLRAGDRLFLVGANGSGKSALIQHLYSLRPSDDIKRIAAHRPTALQSESIYFPHPDRVRFDLQIRERESHPNARWKEDPGFAQQKQLAVLFDLVAAENSDARSVRQLLRDRDFQGATKAASEQESPLGKINELFQSANLGITLKLSDTGDILAQHRDGGIDFSIAQMSDGERNAALIAAEVITAKKESVLLIDEPERHLHRSIIEPFLSALFKQRRDCAFVISTHEIALPAADPDARVLMVRSCQWRLGQVRAWDIDLLDPSVDLPEELKVAILGARRRSVFVEGVSSSSLDHPLYDALFPSLSVIPYEGCGRVQEAVRSLRSSQDLHHVEALYYCSEAIAAVACRQAESLNKDPAAMIKEAKQKALECLRRIDLAERMAARRCERRVRNKIQRCLPTWKEIKAGTNISICFDSPYRDELEHFWQLVADQNLDELIARYPLRDSPVFGAIARALRCQTKGDYEQIVLSRVRADEDLALKIKQRIGLTDDILRA